MAANVWACIRHYNTAAAGDILKLYNHDSHAVEKALESYHDKDSYHGHITGGSGDAEHEGAATARKNAIDHLKAHAPKPVVAPTPKTGPNNALKGANQAKSAALVAIINNPKNDNLETLKTLLQGANSNWKNDRAAWNAYTIKYRAKKGKDPTK